MEQRPKKLLEQVSDVIRLKHYSYITERSYIDWIKRYILFHNKRHPREMSGKEIEEFSTYLAIKENVAASTQNQALSAILFLYKEVLKQELDLKVDAVRAKRSRYVLTVLAKEEALAIINHLSGVHQLVVKLLYGTGIRQTECLQLRVKDLAIERVHRRIASGGHNIPEDVVRRRYERGRINLTQLYIPLSRLYPF